MPYAVFEYVYIYIYVCVCVYAYVHQYMPNILPDGMSETMLYWCVWWGPLEESNCKTLKTCSSVCIGYISHFVAPF